MPETGDRVGFDFQGQTWCAGQVVGPTEVRRARGDPMTISDGVITLLKEYAARPRSPRIPLDAVEAYASGMQDGITVLSAEILEQLKESE